MKHTPGPWKAINWKYHSTSTILADDPCAVGVTRFIAECSTKEDARLIAAAPDLLQALKQMLDAFYHDPLGGGQDAAAEAALDAVAKAQGEK